MKRINRKLNSRRVVLDLCGGTGSWSEPYAKAGYGVELITLPYFDVTLTEISDGYIHFRNKDKSHFLSVPIRSIYGILAAPPCTEFSKAKGNSARDFESAMKPVAACMNIIWAARASGGLKFWALENPVGFLRQFLGVPRYSFYQWQFGAVHVKHTDLWGYFDEPRPLYKNDAEKRGTHARPFALAAVGLDAQAKEISSSQTESCGAPSNNAPRIRQTVL